VEAEGPRQDLLLLRLYSSLSSVPPSLLFRSPAAPLWKLKAHAKTCSSFAFSPLAPGLMATCGMDKTVKLWVRLPSLSPSPPFLPPAVFRVPLFLLLIILFLTVSPVPPSLPSSLPSFRTTRATPALPLASWERRPCPWASSSPSPSTPGKALPSLPPSLSLLRESAFSNDSPILPPPPSLPPSLPSSPFLLATGGDKGLLALWDLHECEGVMRRFGGGVEGGKEGGVEAATMMEGMTLEGEGEKEKGEQKKEKKEGKKEKKEKTAGKSSSSRKK